ncbi:UPF0496 protein 1-like [Dioscorea cayenensis subsp. rotundata]|uniref:UPF0496 protein 1-like n=1 Tax=Dioscorea cayennensis subsp. rotundata TaxID=55577 RepID=A0AB40BME5_DIOCR|nr:UPF0496 protein 1-like [Dioscorea cayenensis subsp. rotundata]
MGSPGHLVNANYVNALPNYNRDSLFDTAAKLYGIKPENVCCVIQLKTEIFADTELSEWLRDQLNATMNTRDAMDVLKFNLHQARPLVLILRDGDEAEADREETLEKLNNLKTMRSILEGFKLVCVEHEKLTTVLDGLSRRKHNLDHNLGRIKAWRKAWNIAQGIVKFGVTVLSVLIPVAGLRPAATAANNGAGGVVALLQPLVDSHLAGQQSSCEDEIDLIEKILSEACFIFHRVKSAPRSCGGVAK